MEIAQDLVLDDMAKTPAELPVPYLFNLLADPKEETDILTDNAWALEPMNRQSAR